MTPITCNRLGTVNVRCTLKTRLSAYVFYPRKAPNFTATRGSGEYTSYLDDGTDQSLLSNASDPDDVTTGPIYAATKLMTFAVSGSDYLVKYVDHAVTDPDDLSGPAMTSVNLGSAGEAIPTPASPSVYGGVAGGSGVSALGGDSISWMEARSTTMHLLTATTSALTREQAFPMTAATECLSSFVTRSPGVVYDGTDFWRLYVNDDNGSLPGDDGGTGVFAIYLVRFAPTPVGEAYDYEKFQITFDDDTLNDAVLYSAMAGYCVTDDTFLIGLGDPTFGAFGFVRYLEITKDGTGYTEYVLSGNEAARAFAEDQGLHFTKYANGCPRFVGYEYTSIMGQNYAEGTYDVTLGSDAEGCSPGQSCAAAYAERIERRAPLTQTITGNRITAGDMQSGTDKRVTSSGDTRIWRDMIDGR